MPPSQGLVSNSFYSAGGDWLQFVVSATIERWGPPEEERRGSRGRRREEFWTEGGASTEGCKA